MELLGVDNALVTKGDGPWRSYLLNGSAVDRRLLNRLLYRKMTIPDEAAVGAGLDGSPECEVKVRVDRRT